MSYNKLCAQAVARQLGVAAVAVADPDAAAALLSALRGLATDRVWNVRRAAAEALPDVSRVGTLGGGAETAVEVLGSLRVDASSWVRSAALLGAGEVFSRAPAGSLTTGAPGALGCVLSDG